MHVCISLQRDNHASTPPLSFLQAGCPSCRPTNSVKVVKANNKCLNKNDRLWVGPIADAVLIFIFWWLSFADFWLLSLYSFYPAHPGLVLPLIVQSLHGPWHPKGCIPSNFGERHTGTKHIWSPSLLQLAVIFRWVWWWTVNALLCALYAALTAKATSLLPPTKYGWEYRRNDRYSWYFTMSRETDSKIAPSPARSMPPPDTWFVTTKRLLDWFICSCK